MRKYLKTGKWAINPNLIMIIFMLIIIACDSDPNQSKFDVEDSTLGLNLVGQEVSLYNKGDQDLYLFAVTAELAAVIDWAPIIDGTPDLVSKETKTFEVYGSDDNSSRYIVYYWFESDDVDKDGTSDRESTIYVDL